MMKKIYIIAIILSTVVLSWISPEIYMMATDEAPEYPLAFYSSVADKYCMFDFTDGKVKRKDLEGNEYTQKQFDSLLPMVYSNQLAYENRLPKEIKGVEVNMQKIRYNSFSYRYKPLAFNKPSIKLYPLFESMSSRVDLAQPQDVFRITDKIEFIDVEKNQVNREKSVLYNKVLFNAGFVGRAKRICGLPTTRKNYDEGYFIIDSNNSLFHMKRVNSKPFIRKVDIDKSIQLEYFEATDFPNRESYGFLFDSVGQIYQLSTDNYKLEKLGIPPIDMNENSVFIMANMFYWNVRVGSKNMKSNYVLDAKTKYYVDSFITENANMIDHWIENVMPFSLSFTSSKDGYVKLRFKYSSYLALLFNLLFVIIYLVMFIRKNKSLSIGVLAWIGITGIYGFISCLLFKSDIDRSI